MNQYIAIAADHAGVDLKKEIIKILYAWNIKVKDFGTDNGESVDYPDYASQVCRSLLSGKSAQGILVCGSGVGMAISANRYKKIRAAVGHNAEEVKRAREHNDINILALGSRTLALPDIPPILKAFLQTPFTGGRHERRLMKIDECL